MDRSKGEVVFYLDGEKAGAQPLKLADGESLRNRSDLTIGSNGLVGAIDFLRVCRGTLADAYTTIEELYEWEFNGPHLYDFAGRKPDGERDAGALELQ